MQKVKPSSWYLSLIAGIIGSIVMFILMKIAIGKGVAPFNVPPSAAMTIRAGLSPKPLALIVHLVYGAVASLIFVAIFKLKAGFWTGILWGLVLWLIMMLIYSPIIGWGVFGFGEAGTLPKEAKLYLQPGPKYLIATLILHLIFGTVIGLLNKWFVKPKAVNPS